MNKRQTIQKEQTQTSHLTGTLEVLRSDVLFESEKLNQIVTNRVTEETNLSKTIEQRDSILKEIEKASRSSEERKLELDRREETLNERSKDIEERLAECAREERLSQQRIDSGLIDFEKKKLELTDEISMLNTFIASVKQHYADTSEALAAKLARIISEIADAEATIKRRGVEIDAQISGLANLNSEFNKTKKELETAKLELTQTLASNENVFKLLEAREIAVSIREKDAEIISRRIKKEYKQLHPNIEINI